MLNVFPDGPDTLVDVKLEKLVVVVDGEIGSPRSGFSRCRVLHDHRMTIDHELFVILAGHRVKGVACVAAQVKVVRRGLRNDHKKSSLRYDRNQRTHQRPAIFAHCHEVGNARLLEHPDAGRGQIGRSLLEFFPRCQYLWTFF